MVTLSQIKSPIEESLNEFDSFVAEQFRSDNSLMSEMIVDALSSRGKGVRPIIAMLVAAMTSQSGVVTKRVHIVSMMVEMIHLASLIHDDVIDEASTRRGRPSLNAKWQSKRAVIAGDYILARNLAIGVSSGQYDLVSHVIGSIATLCEGEVIQDDCARRLTTTRQEYLDIISKKTAALIATAASGGAKATGAQREVVEQMRQFGYYVGMAFQIQDDILDYTPTAKTGKPSFQDMVEGKITLPLLMPLEESSAEQREEVLSHVRQAHLEPQSVEWIARWVEQREGVAMATQVMQAYIERATSILAQFPQSPYRTSLVDLCAYITQRDR
ncbi:MAG: polyprenyl synthetase family protein [Rikenellaceae bacterium]